MITLRLSAGRAESVTEQLRGLAVTDRQGERRQAEFGEDGGVPHRGDAGDAVRRTRRSRSRSSVMMRMETRSTVAFLSGDGAIRRHATLP